MANDIDYLNIEIPEDKPPEEYTYAERRAEIIKYIKKYQDPKLVPKQKLANQYDVSPSTITKDFKIILNYLEKHGGRHAGQRVKIFLDQLFDDIVEKKKLDIKGNKKLNRNLTYEESKELYEFVREHADWLMEVGRIEKAPDKVEGSMAIEINENLINKDEIESED